jgi:putative exporter of polyketide antibiotics
MFLTGGFLLFIWIVAGMARASTFGTIEARAQAVALTTSLPPIFLGLYGGSQPNVVTLGGFANWRYGLVFFLLPGVWSLLALSGTLVNEARRGSMDLLAVTPLPRAQITIEKVCAHIAAMLIVMTVVAITMWVVGIAFGTLSEEEVALLGGSGRDRISLTAAFSYALLLGLVALAIGAIAFALAQFVGRGAAAGIAGLVLAASWVMYGYRESIPVFDALTPLSVFAWTAGHRPIAGTSDWISLIPLVAIVVVGGFIGIVSFDRRDVGAIGSIRTPAMPGALIGIGGPFGRMFRDRLPGAIGWGLGLGILALIIAASGDQLQEAITDQPAIMALFEAAFPQIDITAPGLGLQLAFLAFGYLGIALAAGTFIGGWASDELEGRLEMVLSTSRSRPRWFVSSGLGVFLVIAVVMVITGLGIAAGVATTGEDPRTASLGAGVLGLYGAAVASIGFAVAGLVRSSLAAAAVYAIAVGTILIDILAPVLRLPDWVRDLALTAHFGEPMLGNWDPLGIFISLGLAIGGLAFGAWGFSRRDLNP